jgi:hypothetical protein
MVATACSIPMIYALLNTASLFTRCAPGMVSWQSAEATTILTPGDGVEYGDSGLFVDEGDVVVQIALS